MGDDNTTILIADDHALIRGGLRQVLEGEQSFDIHEADNGLDALEIIHEEEPEICILDVDMPKKSGYEVAQTIHQEGHDSNVIFLTLHDDEKLFNKAMDIGVKGFVLKENTNAEILECVKSVLAGKSYVSPAVSDMLIRRNQKTREYTSESKGLSQLTPAERNIIRHIAELKTNQEIANDLNISINTVQNHRTNICNKLDISGSHALLKYVVEHKEQLT